MIVDILLYLALAAVSYLGLLTNFGYKLSWRFSNPATEGFQRAPFVLIFLLQLAYGTIAGQLFPALGWTVLFVGVGLHGTSMQASIARSTGASSLTLTMAVGATQSVILWNALIATAYGLWMGYDFHWL